MLRIMGILAGLVWLILLGYTEWTERDMEQRHRPMRATLFWTIAWVPAPPA